MAVTDIRLSVDFFTDMKIEKLLRSHHAEGVLGLLRLWVYVVKHCPSGIINDADMDDLEIITKVTDKAFIPDLITLKLLVHIDHKTYQIPNWEKNQSWVVGAQKRSEKAKNAAKHRWENEHGNNT